MYQEHIDQGFGDIELENNQIEQIQKQRKAKELLKKNGQFKRAQTIVDMNNISLVCGDSAMNQMASVINFEATELSEGPKSEERSLTLKRRKQENWYIQK